jgi:glycosyltransferase involved in cell wall biosynthesis
MTVSIIIPLYNYARWIGEAVQSALDQLYPVEIIVVDDCSTDNPIIPKGIKVIRFTHNQGVAVARNTGIAQAQGDLIICLDADDKLKPDAVGRLVPEFEDPRVGVAFAPLVLINEAGAVMSQRWFMEQFNYKGQTEGRNQVPTCAMFRREAWERAGGFRTYEKPCEDAAFWLRVASQGWKVKNIHGDSMLFYRTHGVVSEARAGSETQLNPPFDWWKVGREWKNRNSGIGAPVQIYDCPRVSFVTSYRVKDEQAFIRTLDSIEGLKAIDWEICAAGIPSPLVRDGFPFVRWGSEPCGSTVVYLEPGEIITESAWQQIIISAEWPV